MCCSSLCYNRCFAYVKTEPKWIYYFDCTNAANKNCVEFCMKEVFKCRSQELEVLLAQFPESFPMPMKTTQSELVLTRVDSPN